MKTSSSMVASRYVFSYGSALIFILPTYILINLSLRPATDFSPAVFPTSNPTFDNFVTAWMTSDIGGSIVTSVIVTTISCLAIVIISTMAAYPLARSTSRMSTGTYYFFLVGLLLPFQLATLPLYLIFRDWGLLGSPLALIIYYAGSQMPFSIFLVATFLRANIAPEYEEAARIDGCGDGRVFLTIVIPLLRPVIGTLIILNGISIWNDFFVPLLYLGGSGVSTIPVELFKFVGQYTTNWPLVFAGLIISMTPMLLLFLVFQRYVVKGFASGLKG